MPETMSENMTGTTSGTSATDEIDLIELIEILWGGKWLIVAVTGVISLISLTVLLMLPSTQSVELRIRPPVGQRQENAF